MLVLWDLAQWPLKVQLNAEAEVENSVNILVHDDLCDSGVGNKSMVLISSSAKNACKCFFVCDFLESKWIHGIFQFFVFHDYLWPLVAIVERHVV